MSNVSDKVCRGNQNTHFVFSNFLFFENRAVYERMWKNIIEPDRPQMTIWRVRIAGWIPKATNTHSQYVILIAFPLQHWASMLRYTYIGCLVLLMSEEVTNAIQKNSIWKWALKVTTVALQQKVIHLWEHRNPLGCDAVSFSKYFSTFRTSQRLHLQGQLNVVDYTCRCYTLNE